MYKSEWEQKKAQKVIKRKGKGDEDVDAVSDED